jgi:hypothetical protein
MVPGNKQRRVRVLGGLMIEEFFYNQSSNSMANGNTVRCHAMLDRKVNAAQGQIQSGGYGASECLLSAAD